MCICSGKWKYHSMEELRKIHRSYCIAIREVTTDSVLAMLTKSVEELEDEMRVRGEEPAQRGATNG